MANLPVYTQPGIPRYGTPLANQYGSPVEPWYRFWKRLLGVPQLIQDTLANRPPATNFVDGSVLFIDTASSKMYYVAAGAWVQVVV